MAETAIPEDVEDYVDNPRYSEAKNDEGPILELTEREKTEIRRFIASARINVGDISNLKKMCKIIGAWNSRTQPYRIGSNSDLKKLKACFAGISQISGTTEAEVLAARKINDIIISHSLFSLGDWPASERSTIAKQIYSHVSLIEPLADDPLLQDKLDAEGARKNFVEAFQALRTFDLQHECRRIIDRLCDFYKEREYETVPPPISRNVLKNKILRVVHRILELVHRLILDDLLNGSLDKRSDVSKQRRVTGQTRDELRTGGLKIVSRVLARDIQEQGKKWKRFRVFTNEPRHLIRAIDPSVTDVVFGQRLGTLAVDNAMAGYTGFMVSQWLTEYVLVPLELAILGRKRVPENGIFWKSVMAGTGQDAAKISEFKVMDSVRSEFASNQ
jgi:hypothetical protein